MVYSRIAPEISTYMGSVFEQICTQYLWNLLLRGDSPINFPSLGRWWGTNPKTKKQEEIDIMGVDNDSALFAECKWTNEKVDSSVLETLLMRSEMFSYSKKHFFLFAKRGFTKGCFEQANKLGNVSLVQLEDMF